MANHLFEANKTEKNITEKYAQTFHMLVEKLLFLSNRERPSIITRVVFLVTIVRNPDKDDWKKLGRVLNYLQITHYLVLTLESDGSGTIKWWVDATFSVTTV